MVEKEPGLLPELEIGGLGAKRITRDGETVLTWDVARYAQPAMPTDDAITEAAFVLRRGRYDDPDPERMLGQSFELRVDLEPIVSLPIGDYGYKENFNIGWEPLADMALPLTWRAWPSVAAGRAKAALRRSPLARRLRDGMRRKRPRSAAR